jgi:transketolase
MINQSVKLREDVFEPAESAATRDGFGAGVVEAGKADPRVVVLSADLAESTRAEWFQREFPERFIEVGVAEQNMAAVAAGMAAAGKIPFITSYAMFSPGRSWEQVRTTIALNDQPVIICGMHAGISVGPDGATHQALEDIALMRVLPNMIVISPCDAEEARKATIIAAKLGKPAYLRFGRAPTPKITTPETPFEIGKSLVMWRSNTPKVALLATGPLVHHALLAARELDESGLGTVVVNVPSIKPLDIDGVISVAKECGRVITIEEHQVAGGFGSAIAEVLSRHHPVPMRFVGVQDRFGQSGEPNELLSTYGIDVHTISAAAREIVVS